MKASLLVIAAAAIATFLSAGCSSQTASVDRLRGWTRVSSVGDIIVDDNLKLTYQVENGKSLCFAYRTQQLISEHEVVGPDSSLSYTSTHLCGRVPARIYTDGAVTVNLDNSQCYKDTVITMNCVATPAQTPTQTP
jgi:hypothetical protein